MKIENRVQRANGRSQKSETSGLVTHHEPVVRSAFPTAIVLLTKAVGEGGSRITFTQSAAAPSPQCSVQNTDGFWELTFAGKRAVLPQHQGLFYVAFLLADPHAAPIPAADLAGEVFECYGEHEDFRPPIPSWYRDDARVAKILLRKQKRLEGIVDRDEEDIVVRAEALRELIVLDELKRVYFSQIAREAKNASEMVSDVLRELHAMLATAVDARGNPHRLIRDFGMHLLHYVLMPSNRVSAKERVALLVYRPA